MSCHYYANPAKPRRTTNNGFYCLFIMYIVQPTAKKGFVIIFGSSQNSPNIQNVLHYTTQLYCTTQLYNNKIVLHNTTILHSNSQHNCTTFCSPNKTATQLIHNRTVLLNKYYTTQLYYTTKCRSQKTVLHSRQHTVLRYKQLV